MQINATARINWPAVLFLCLTPPAAVALTIYYLKTEGFDWRMFALAGVFYTLTAGSITAGYHRYFSHKTYEAREWVKWFWALFGAASFQNSILIWARDHRVHHRFVDSNEDPYSINKGFFYAHFGWMLMHEPTAVNIDAYGRDLARDPVVMFQDKYYVPIAVAMGFGLPTLIGWAMGSALGGFAIAGVLRIVLVHHMTFFINSFCHVWGRQTYTDTNTARDSFLMALATFGEGYHNFHHIFSTDYRNGVRWYHWDPTKWTIQILRLVGGAHSLKRTPDVEILRRRLAMDEKRVKSHLSTRWHAQVESQVVTLRAHVEASFQRFENLRAEYRQLARECRQASIERIAEVRLQLRMAKIECRAAYRQWRVFQRGLLAA